VASESSYDEPPVRFLPVLLTLLLLPPLVDVSIAIDPLTSSIIAWSCFMISTNVGRMVVSRCQHLLMRDTNGAVVGFWMDSDRRLGRMSFLMTPTAICAGSMP
jgi:hypothetical protein